MLISITGTSISESDLGVETIADAASEVFKVFFSEDRK